MATVTTQHTNEDNASVVKAAVAAPYAWCCGIDTHEAMIGCDASVLTMNASGCTEWYHLSCVCLAHLKEDEIQNMEWKCALCKKYLSQSALLREPKNNNKSNPAVAITKDRNEKKYHSIFQGLTTEQIATMKNVMKSMQNEYNDYCKKDRKREIKEAQKHVAFYLGITVNDKEAAFIVEYLADNHQDLQDRLQNEGLPFLQSMQEMMEQSKRINNRRQNMNDNNTNKAIQNNTYQDTDWVMNEKRRKAQFAERRKQVPRNTNLDGTVRCGRLLLNDALQNTVSMDGWSTARIKAWQNRHKQTNAYFYRFNVPGQKQRNGKWIMQEHTIFMERVLQFGVNDQWGIFSQTIPGRVGYQCSNYWRGLVKDGDVIDPNYHYDGKKLHFKRHTKTFSIATEYRRYAITVNRDASGIWTNLPKKHPLHPSAAYCQLVEDALGSSTAYISSAKAVRKRVCKRKREEKDLEQKDVKIPMNKKRRKNKRNAKYDETFHCKASIQRQKWDNPMPDFIDCMTGNTVIKPTISPYGHVLGYDTWSKILRSAKHKDICPFTLRKLNRRTLVKLNKENYEEYQDKIINITDEQKELLAAIHSE